MHQSACLIFNVETQDVIVTLCRCFNCFCCKYLITKNQTVCVSFSITWFTLSVYGHPITSKSPKAALNVSASSQQAASWSEVCWLLLKPKLKPVSFGLNSSCTVIYSTIYYIGSQIMMLQGHIALWGWIANRMWALLNKNQYLLLFYVLLTMS